jgi:hypothetical protein
MLNMSVPLHFVVVGSGQVTNLCNLIRIALMLVFGVLHHPFIWQCYHCLPFIKFLYFVVTWCVTKLKGESVGVLPDMGSMSLLITEVAGI